MCDGERHAMLQKYNASDLRCYVDGSDGWFEHGEAGVLLPAVLFLRVFLLSLCSRSSDQELNSSL